MINPYTDDYMTYNERRGRYILTPKAVFDKLGIDLNVEIKQNPNGVNAFLSRVSDSVYRKIHEYGENDYQDKVIAYTQKGREIIFECMLEQFFYMKNVGDLSLSTDSRERALYAADSLLEILDETIPEIGRSIINIGRC